MRASLRTGVVGNRPRRRAQKTAQNQLSAGSLPTPRHCLATVVAIEITYDGYRSERTCRRNRTTTIPISTYPRSTARALGRTGWDVTRSESLGPAAVGSEYRNAKRDCPRDPKRRTRRFSAASSSSDGLSRAVRQVRHGK